MGADTGESARAGSIERFEWAGLASLGAALVALSHFDRSIDHRTCAAVVSKNDPPAHALSVTRWSPLRAERAVSPVAASGRDRSWSVEASVGCEERRGQHFACVAHVLGARRGWSDDPFDRCAWFACASIHGEHRARVTVNRELLDGRRFIRWLTVCGDFYRVKCEHSLGLAPRAAALVGAVDDRCHWIEARGSAETDCDEDRSLIVDGRTLEHDTLPVAQGCVRGGRTSATQRIVRVRFVTEKPANRVHSRCARIARHRSVDHDRSQCGRSVARAQLCRHRLHREQSQ